MAKYHRAQKGDIVAVNGDKGRRKDKPQEEWILTPGAFQGIVPVDQFRRVQAKLPQGSRKARRPKAVYPLSGLVYCEHCGKPMTGSRDQSGKVFYVCSTYLRRGRQNSTGCGKHKLDARRLEKWLANALRDYYLGAGRDELLAAIRRELKTEAKTSKADLKRLEKRAGELEKEVGRLVKAIRTTDAPELAEELQAVRVERQGVQEALQRAQALQDVKGIDLDAEAVLDELRGLWKGLSMEDPASVREVFRLLVLRIECRWEPAPAKGRGEGKRQSCRLVGGVVYLRDPRLVTCAGHAEA